MEGELLRVCEAGALGSTAPGPCTPGLQQLSQVSGLRRSPRSAPGLAEMLSQVPLQPLPLGPCVLLEAGGRADGRVSRPAGHLRPCLLLGAARQSATTRSPLPPRGPRPLSCPASLGAPQGRGPLLTAMLLSTHSLPTPEVAEGRERGSRSAAPESEGDTERLRGDRAEPESQRCWAKR